MLLSRFLFISLLSFQTTAQASPSCFKLVDQLLRQPHKLKHQPHKGQFRPHFTSWLEKNNYHELLERKPHWSSFGGKVKSGQNKIKRTPTLFIHGNSDSALGYAEQGDQALNFTGWRYFLDYFHKKGVSEAEVYGISWGDANPNMAQYQVHNYENIMRVRLAIEALSEYSKQELGNKSGRINIVSHSMGVTLALKAILGGDAYDASGLLFLQMRVFGMHGQLRKPLTTPMGEVGSLSERIDHFVGISGASRGLDSCKGMGLIIPTCSDIIGLQPGSRLLEEIWAHDKTLARNIYSIYSESDEILSSSNYPHRPEGITSELPFSKREIVFDESRELDHFESKDQSPSLVWKLLNP